MWLATSREAQIHFVGIISGFVKFCKSRTFPSRLSCPNKCVEIRARISLEMFGTGARTGDRNQAEERRE